MLVTSEPTVWAWTMPAGMAALWPTAPSADCAVLSVSVLAASMAMVPLSLLWVSGPWGYAAAASTGHGPGLGSVGVFCPKYGCR